MLKARLVKILEVDSVIYVPVRIHISGTYDQWCNRNVSARYIGHWASFRGPNVSCATALVTGKLEVINIFRY
jgi:hypothetical protein|tara:strand:+ start:1760 stop:1975 length:216 start_codon:yes stop_codon:yes gene_type:complete